MYVLTRVCGYVWETDYTNLIVASENKSKIVEYVRNNYPEANYDKDTKRWIIEQPNDGWGFDYEYLEILEVCKI
jgi:hypothetical protein